MEDEMVVSPIVPRHLPISTRLSFSSRLVSVFLLCAFAFLCLWDRYATAGVLSSVQSFYSISNGVAGLLQTTFIVVFVVSVIVTGYLGDRYRRRPLLLIGAWFWLIAVSVSSFIPANSFWLFLAVRSAAAVGNGMVRVIIPTLFADYFTGKARGYSLMALFTMLPLGISTGVVTGPLILAWGVDWQWTLRVVPVLGLPLLFAMQIQLVDVRESGGDGNERKDSFLADVLHIIRIRTIVLIMLSLICINFYVRANAWWSPTLLLNAMKYTRYDPNVYHGIGYASAQSMLSVSTILAGLLGTSLTVWVSECWRDGRLCLPRCSGAPGWVTTVGCALAVPSIFLYLHSVTYNIYVCVTFAFLAAAVSGGTLPLTTEMIMNTTLPRRRAAANALANLAMSITGDGPAPLIVGQISDWIRGVNDDDEAQFYSLFYAMFFPAGLCIGSVVFVALGTSFYKEDLRKTQNEIRIVEETKKCSTCKGNPDI